MRRLVVKVWEFPVRVIHWTNFLAVVLLSVTGAYIHWPFLSTPTGPAPWLMGWMRLVHFVAGWALLLGLLGRWGWSFVGNRYANVREFFPIFYKERRRDIWGVLKYYAFASRHLPPHLGHNALASMVYLGVFCLMWFQVITGFALFGQYDPNGTAYALFGWVFRLAESQWVRLAHYFAAWVFAAFLINHIYAMWVSDLAEKDGTAGSMFSGYKYGPLEEFADLDHRPWKSFDDRRRGGA
jgi:Ni/Fe-hydrogenase 1 B-type cytochrome subunit